MKVVTFCLCVLAESVCRRTLMTFLGEGKYVTSNSQLDFGGDPYHNVHTRILEEFLSLLYKGNSANFTDNSTYSRSC